MADILTNKIWPLLTRKKVFISAPGCWIYLLQVQSTVHKLMSLLPKIYGCAIHNKQDISKKVSWKDIFSEGRYSLRCKGKSVRQKWSKNPLTKHIGKEIRSRKEGLLCNLTFLGVNNDEISTTPLLEIKKHLSVFLMKSLRVHLQNTALKMDRKKKTTSNCLLMPN